MKVASITETKNRLSALLDLVRSGETVVIVDRGRPVARLVPAVGNEDAGDDEARLARLERAGLIRRGNGKRVDRLLTPPPDVGGGVLEALLEERREGR